MNILPAYVVLAALLSQSSEPANLSRTYKPGEKVVYRVTQSIDIGGPHSFTVDLALTANKVSEKGEAELGVHMSNLQSTAGGDKVPPLPADFTLKIGEHNMPVQFTPTMGGIDFEVLILQVAAYMPDKALKAGDEYPILWNGSAATFTGTGKVVEISVEKKIWRAQTKVKVVFQGQDAGEFTFSSTYELGNGSLIESKGLFSLGPQNFTFKRKNP